MVEEQQFLLGMATPSIHTGKGKRTKRLRLLSPCGGVAATVTASSCSSVSGGDNMSFSSSMESADREEEDMANCLILLAQGGGSQSHHQHHHQQKQQPENHDEGEKTEKGNTASKRFAEIATATNPNTKAGFFIYECKTCNRTFPSFQALGGHRASHKRPKVTVEEKKLSPPPPPPPSSQPHQLVVNYGGFEEAGLPRGGGPSISLQLGRSGFNGNNNKAKIHECSICGSEFTSGQALGGHMRRHRASANAAAETNSNAITSTTVVARPPRNILQLDLNLPAPPEDDLRESKFQFPATQKSMVLSAAPALVDCHY